MISPDCDRDPPGECEQEYCDPPPFLTTDEKNVLLKDMPLVLEQYSDKIRRLRESNAFDATDKELRILSWFEKTLHELIARMDTLDLIMFKFDLMNESHSLNGSYTELKRIFSMEENITDDDPYTDSDMLADIKKSFADRKLIQQNKKRKQSFQVIDLDKC